MTTLAITLLAISIGDLFASGLSGTPLGLTRAVHGVVSALAVAIFGLALAGVHLEDWIAPLLIVGTGSSLWLLLRVPPPTPSTDEESGTPSPAITRSAWWPLAILAATLFSAALLQPATTEPARLATLLSPLSQQLPSASITALLLLLGAGLLQASTANAIVRALLEVAGPLQISSKRLQGGRIIGLLERLLIFGLALSGQPAAAALIASAKSILRFPEISAQANREITSEEDRASVDEITEYFLIGSLASWSVALAGAALVRLAL